LPLSGTLPVAGRGVIRKRLAVDGWPVATTRFREVSKSTVATPRTISEESPDGDPVALLRPVPSPALSDDELSPTATSGTPLISIVVPAMNEEGNIPALYQAIIDVLEPAAISFEIVFIDDGSRDRTWDAMLALAAADARVVAFRHRRNFGKARGLATGFQAAQGRFIVTMDADLQDDPVEIPRFLEKLDEGYDLVSGWKQRRQDPLGKTLPSRVFNATVREVSGVPLHDFNCGFKIYRQEVVRTIRLYGELHRFTPVLAHAEGFRVGELPVRHHARKWGTSKYGWSRLIKGFLDLLTVKFLTEYRQRPMHVLGVPGIISLAAGAFFGLWLTAEKFLTGASIGNRPLLLLAILLIVVGVQFFGLGMLGELLTHGSQRFDAVRGAPIREAAGARLERERNLDRSPPR
jgi:glycosyltransferase involved in cell wall biosynthesis